MWTWDEGQEENKALGDQVAIAFSHYSDHFSSVAQSCPTLHDPMDSSMPGFLSITNSQSLLKFMSIKTVMPSNHLILCRPVFLLPSIFPSIRVFSDESLLCIRRPKYWSFRFSLSPSSEYSGLDEAQAGIKIARRNINNLLCRFLSKAPFIVACPCWTSSDSVFLFSHGVSITSAFAIPQPH